jgi:arsenate reductase
MIGKLVKQMMNKQTVLFIDTFNADCSQMLEGLLTALYGERFVAYSAGIQPNRVNKNVIKVMREIGIDLLTHRSKSVDEFRDMHFDYIVSASDNIKNVCRFLPNGKTYLHVNFVLPIADISDKSEGPVLNRIRAVRDEIRAWVITSFGSDE